MCIVKEVTLFLKNGVKTFRASSHGQYHEESEGIEQIKEDIFSTDYDDKDNLKKDVQNVGRDMRKAISKLEMGNG